MVPEKKRWGGGGTSAATVPTVSGVKEFSQTEPIVLVKRTKKLTNVVKVPTVHRNLDADGSAR